MAHKLIEIFIIEKSRNPELVTKVRTNKRNTFPLLPLNDNQLSYIIQLTQFIAGNTDIIQAE